MLPGEMPPSRKDRFRLLLIALFILCLFASLIIQYYKIQIIEGEHWTSIAKKQHFFIVKEPFTRGTFYSNPFVKKGHPERVQKLAFDIKKFHLFIDPESIPDPRKREIASVLVKHLDLSKDEAKTLGMQFSKKSRSRKLAMWLDPELKDSILEWWNPYAKKYKIPRNAVFFVPDYQRSYPFGKLLGQVLHTVQSTKEEKTDKAYPTGGLELYFDKILRGSVGKRRLMRSPRNAIETGDVISEPVHGADVYLTINPTLQAICEEELERGVKKCKAKSGRAIIMDPKTGEVYAIAQFPFFYPSDYQKFFNDKTLIENTKVKAVTDANEIGSVMKPITAAIALLANEELAKRGEKPLFSPEEKIACASGKFPGRSKPITDTHSHSFLNMDMAIQKSSNIYMARLVERIINRLGAEWYRSKLADVFGFGKKTGIELPGESPGVLPTPGKKHPNGTFEWSTPTPFSMSFGHNLQVTSFQILSAYTVFANDGRRVRPTLLKKISKRTQNGSEEVLFESRTQQENCIPASIAKRVALSIKFATKPGGTARKGDVFGFTESGKTSTAKKIVNGRYSETQYVASFVGFCPAARPEILVLVSMDEPEYGYIPGVGKNHNATTAAAPVFREISRRSLEYLGVPKDDPYGYPVGDPRYHPEKADYAEEVKKLNALYEQWNGKH